MMRSLYLLVTALLVAMTEYGAASPAQRLLPIQYSAAPPYFWNVVGAAGQPIALRVEIPAEFRDVQFLAIRGLPRELSLSAGFSVGAAWYVPFYEVAALTLTSPADFTGNFVLDATLFKELRGGPIGQIYITLAIRPPHAAGIEQADTAPLSQAPRGPPILAADEENSLARGMTFMKQGDIAAARLVFYDLAQRGSSKGARAMGETYDPLLLGRIFVAGLRANVEEAKRWYRLAAKKGDEEAQRRLAALRASP